MATRVLALLAIFRGVSACTILAVGRDASATGYPMVTHTDDGGPPNDVRLVRVPRRQWPAGSMRPIYQWQDQFPRMVSSELLTPDYLPRPGQSENVVLGYIPQVSETWAYWDVDYGMMNEWGLSIGESTGNAKTAGWAKKKEVPYGYNLLGIEDLSKIALERCKTAKCAAETMGALAVEHGFYCEDSGDPAAPDYSDSAEILVLADADPGDVWHFNVMTGKNNGSAIWAAKRLPPNHVTVVADSFSFKLNLSDHENNIYSPCVTCLADEMGWRRKENEKLGEFDFFGAYGFEPKGSLRTLMTGYIARRIWRGYTLLAPEEGAKLNPKSAHFADGERLPESLPARKGSVTVAMLINANRDHYEGTPYDLTVGMAAGPFGNPNRIDHSPPGQWERAFSIPRTILSHVLEPRPHGRSIGWFSYDAPHGSPYLPFYAAALDSAPDSYHSQVGDMSVFNRGVAFWAFSFVNQWSNLNFQLINGEVRKRCELIEAEAALLIKAWENEADAAGNLPNVDHVDTALLTKTQLQMLTGRSNDFAASVVAEWWRFSEHLISKYSRQQIDYTEDNQWSQRYPDWWLDSPEVGFRLWTVDGPYHGITCKVGEVCGDSKRDISVPVVALQRQQSPAFVAMEDKHEPPAATTLTMRSLPVTATTAAAFTLVVSLSLSVLAAAYWMGVRRGRRENLQDLHAGGYMSITA